jgi:hypothetical protein
MIQLRKFNQAGIEAFEDALQHIGAGQDADISALLTDPALTEALSAEPVVEVRPFKDRFDAAQYFYTLLLPFEKALGDIERDKGLWAWLAAAWIDMLAPKDEAGSRKLRARPRWVPAVDDYKAYYRHLLAGPYRIYRAHHDDPSRAMVVLNTAVEQPGEVVEQLASRQEVITSPPLMSAITTLYYRETTGKLKSGAAGKGGGSARRLIDVIQQFDLTWDVYGLDPPEFLALLPAEFDRFKQP